MRRARWLLPVVLIPGLLLFVLRQERAPEPPRAARAARPAPARARTTGAAAAPSSPHRAEALRSSTAKEPPSRAAGVPPRDTGQRSELLRRLAQARRDRAAGQPAAVQADALDPLYIQQRMREVLPLVSECYELAVERRPGLGGQLDLEFTLAGEADVGGLVESVTALPSSTLQDAELGECIGETVSSLTFAPPRDGGRVVVRYPLHFAQESPR